MIGGGLLGLEAARGLLERGLEVHVVHLMPHLMEVQLDAAARRRAPQRTLEQMGVNVHLEKSTTSVALARRAIPGSQFADGATLACDMVVISAGIRPNVQLARRAGLNGRARHRRRRRPDGPGRRGTSIAIGECAEHRGQVYGLVAPLWEQTRVLADR